MKNVPLNYYFISIILIILGVIPNAIPEFIKMPFWIRIVYIATMFILAILVFLGKTLVKKIGKLITILYHPLARIIYFLIITFLIIYFSNYNLKIIILIGIFLALSLASIKWFPAKVNKFEDKFDNGLVSWNIITGNPSINLQFGNPAPNLDLHVVNGLRTNCFLTLAPIETPRKGMIECDVYLESNSLFNIVFRADPFVEQWYMARLDTRPGMQDGFLKDNGSGWTEFSMSSANSSPSTWHRIKIELDGPKAKLYRDGRLLAKLEDSDFEMGKIGIFNEVGEAHVDNFLVTKIE